jgi:hypothetical protein
MPTDIGDNQAPQTKAAAYVCRGQCGLARLHAVVDALHFRLGQMQKLEQFLA